MYICGFCATAEFLVFVLCKQMKRVINKGPLPYQYMKIVLCVQLLCPYTVILLAVDIIEEH